MTSLLFPDNTVLVRFARIEKMDLLGMLVGINGRWCGSVAAECDRSASLPGLEDMSKAHKIFGAPLLLETAKEIIDTEAIRDSMASPGDHRTKHLGEAETIAILTNRGIEGVFVTDDQDAARRARSEGIVVYCSWDLLRLAVRVGLATVDEAYNDILILNGHREKHPHVHSREAWTEWCAA